MAGPLDFAALRLLLDIIDIGTTHEKVRNDMTGGTLIRVIPKTLFDFGWLGNSETHEFIVAKALNVIPYGAAYLWVRVYNASVAGGTITVNATPALPSDDTQQSFLGTAITLAVTTAVAGDLLNTSLTPSAALPPYLQISVKGQQGATASPNMGIELSIDVLARCCG